MITDRDITVRATSAGESPEDVTVGDVMSTGVRWCAEDDDVADAERIMSELQVRRLPVVNASKNLVGMVTLGDLATEHESGVGETLDKVSRPAGPDRR